jgi:hypothetical protein
MSSFFHPEYFDFGQLPTFYEKGALSRQGLTKNDFQNL